MPNRANAHLQASEGDAAGWFSAQPKDVKAHSAGSETGMTERFSA